MHVVAIHLNHDSTVSLDLGGELHNIELERVYGKRHYDIRQERPSLEELAALIHSVHRGFDLGMAIGGVDADARALFAMLEVASIETVDHHAAHAAAAFYQSPFDRSLIVSYDGGGNDGTFRMFVADREAGLRALDDGHRLNLGIPYRALAHPIREIHKPDDGKERSSAGKLMGLAAYGSIRPEWTSAITDYFVACSQIGITSGMYRQILDQLVPLGRRIQLDLSRNALAGRDAYDLARTGQHVFETIFLETTLPVIEAQQLPVCITGGCALNVVVNQRLADTVRHPIFVPPNPNDCGLASGALLHRARPKAPAVVTYSGAPILDIDTLPAMAARYGATTATPADIAQLLHDGHVLAVMRDRSEHGPRALGHRSILCHPGVPGMKDRLNGRVKFRESFRPYAPVVRREDVNRFFKNARNDLSFMSFNPTVRAEWRTPLAAACHLDGTARAQTVTRKQNPWLYDVLAEFERLSGFGALVNTSFNSKGRPMVTRVAEAIDLLQITDLDCLLVENILFRKST